MPLTEEQRAIGELARLVANDPPEFQREVYAPLQALEARIKAAEERAAAQIGREQQELDELTARYARLVAALNHGSPIGAQRLAPAEPTRWERLRVFLSDYFSAPY